MSAIRSEAVVGAVQRAHGLYPFFMLWMLASRLYQTPFNFQTAVLIVPGLLLSERLLPFKLGLPLLSHTNDFIIRVFFLLRLVRLVQHHKVTPLLLASLAKG